MFPARRVSFWLLHHHHRHRRRHCRHRQRRHRARPASSSQDCGESERRPNRLAARTGELASSNACQAFDLLPTGQLWRWSWLFGCLAELASVAKIMLRMLMAKARRQKRNKSAREGDTCDLQVATCEGQTQTQNRNRQQATGNRRKSDFSLNLNRRFVSIQDSCDISSWQRQQQQQPDLCAPLAHATRVKCVNKTR